MALRESDRHLLAGFLGRQMVFGKPCDCGTTGISNILLWLAGFDSVRWSCSTKEPASLYERRSSKVALVTGLGLSEWL